MEPAFLHEIVDLRHRLHRIPEAAFCETKTKETLQAFLRRRTDLVLTDHGCWFTAYYDCGDPTAEVVAYRADMDALPIPETDTLPYHSCHPGYSCACGHDGHSAALAGFGWLLAGQPPQANFGTTSANMGERSHECGVCTGLPMFREKPHKNVWLVFQHAEEVGGGGEECARWLESVEPDRVYAFHNMSGWPAGMVLCRPGLTHCASAGLTVRYQGKTAHASTPENGINPAAALASLALAIRDIPGAEGYTAPVLATIVHMTAGSRNFGIAADQGELSVTLRARSDGDMALLRRRVLDAAAALAAKEGLVMTTAEEDVFPATVNDEREAQRVSRAAEEAGIAHGLLPEPYRASEDFGHYLRHIPGAMFYVGNGESWPPIHDSGFDFNDSILPVVLRMFRQLLDTKIPAPAEERSVQV